MNKKELKEAVKAKREEIAGYGGISPYINLKGADEAKMIEWLKEAEKSLQKYKDWEEKKTEEVEEGIDLRPINNAKTLNQLLSAIKNLSGKSEYKDWQFTPWTKNGQARVYGKDISYSNPKTRGYFLINTSGEIKKIEESKNRPLPDLPILPRDFYHNDIIPEDSGKGDIDSRVGRYLKNEFPGGNWNGQDYDDAYEMFSK